MGFFQYLHHLDKDVTLAINSLHCTFTDYIWMVFSNREIWYALYVAVLVFFFVRLGWKKARIATLACILCVVACDQFANFTKDFFQRLRPCLDGEMLSRGLHTLEGAGNLYGFYSAHAANAMGFAVCSWLCFRNDAKYSYRYYGIGIFIWGFLVGMSRVFVGKHFFGDVLAGYAVGLLFGWVIASLAGLIIRKAFPPSVSPSTPSQAL